MNAAELLRAERPIPTLDILILCGAALVACAFALGLTGQGGCLHPAGARVVTLVDASPASSLFGPAAMGGELLS